MVNLIVCNSLNLFILLNYFYYFSICVTDVKLLIEGRLGNVIVFCLNCMQHWRQNQKHLRVWGLGSVFMKCFDHMIFYSNLHSS